MELINFLIDRFYLSVPLLVVIILLFISSSKKGGLKISSQKLILLRKFSDQQPIEKILKNILLNHFLTFPCLIKFLCTSYLLIKELLSLSN